MFSHKSIISKRCCRVELTTEVEEVRDSFPITVCSVKLFSIDLLSVILERAFVAISNHSLSEIVIFAENLVLFQRSL